MVRTWKPSWGPLLSCLLVLCLAAPATPAWGVSPPKDQKVTRMHSTMGTLVTITVWTDRTEAAAEAIQAAFAEFDRINVMMTTWLPESPVSQVNSQPGAWVTVPEEVTHLVALARTWSRKTGGAFDITVGAFKGLWKFDEDKDGTLPSMDAVKERVANVGYKRLRVRDKRNQVRLGPGQRMTLGGIAKGYATDRAAQILRDADLPDFMVQAGGDMYISGRKGDQKWRVGIRDPRGPADKFFAYAEVENKTFSTSGDYERFVLRDGKRYHHILNPKTGMPANLCRSVTVMAEDALTADILSTALFVMGHKRGMRLVKRLKGVEAAFVDADNQLHLSPGMKRALKIVAQPSEGP